MADLEKAQAAAEKAKAAYQAKQTPKNKEAHRVASQDLNDARKSARQTRPDLTQEG